MMFLHVRADASKVAARDGVERAAVCVGSESE